MELDMMLVSSTEDIDLNQEFFEKGSRFPLRETTNRFKEEYVPNEWDMFVKAEELQDEKEKISDRQIAVRRIQSILQEISPKK